MKKILPLLAFIFIAFQINAQLTFTEISYNPPESGTDSLEYIELYNSTDADIDLTGYIIRDNNSHTIAGGMVPAMGYAILAIKPAAIMVVLGFSSIEIADIALSNGGEQLTIENTNGEVLDQITYDDNEPWPTNADGTDGAGATIELCDLESDNSDGANWGVSTNNLNIIVNETDFFGTPGNANSSSCEFVPDHVVEVSTNVFTPADITIQMGESVRWVNTDGFHNINGTSSTYPNNPVGFGNGSASSTAWTYDFTFEIAGVHNYQCDPHVDLGMTGTVTVEGDVEPIVPTYDISIVNTIDAEGVGDSVGVMCTVVGIVHGANLRGGGLQFALIDDSGDALGLFSSTDLGYTYAEGDKIKATGSISQFNGLLQIAPNEIEFISLGQLRDPIKGIQRLDENTESQFIQTDEFAIVDAAAWLGDGSSFNVEFENSLGDIITLRIDSDTEVASWEAPFFLGGNPVLIQGIGGQYDDMSPYLQGYQMFPRYNSDFLLDVATAEIQNVNIEIYPNPAQSSITINTDVKWDKIELVNILGNKLLNITNRTKLSVTSLPKGLYFINFTKNDKIQTERFVKQ
ncbi:MAG: lamin tail domain-containing protein [Saprospiraceae bacterium]